MNITFFDISLVVLSLIVLVIVYLKRTFNYWKIKGLPTLNPTIPFGDTADLFLGKCTFGEQFAKFYKEFKKRGVRHGGVFMGPKPFYVPLDPEIIKSIMQKDFQHFVNRGFYIDEENDPLSVHLFNLEDQKWKNMRIKLTPTFTSGKMKMMFETFASCTIGLKSIMEKTASAGEPLDVKEILGRFTTDIIGSVAFGIECNSLKDPDTLFRKYGKMTFELDGIRRLKFLIQFTFPRSILRRFKFKINPPEVENFFMKTVEKTVAYREKNNIVRKDFLHLLLQLKNKGKITDDDNVSNNVENIEQSLNMNELTAQVFVFFLAGFETSSTTMTFALYELSQNPEIQDKVRNEIETVLKKHDGKMTYEAIMEMTYMDKVINETLRKYPPVPLLNRKCNKKYTVPNSNIVIEENMDVGIAVQAIHHDPEYYPNPEIFDPDRFSEEEKNKRPPFTWLPFGEGPRICIGLRFGVLQSKVGLATLLQDYKVTLNSKTKTPLVMDKYSFIMAAKGGIWLDVHKI